MKLLEYKYLHLWIVVSSMNHPVNFVKPMKRINISLHKKTNIKYAHQDKWTMLQADECYSKYITIPDRSSDDNFGSKEKPKMMLDTTLMT